MKSLLSRIITLAFFGLFLVSCSTPQVSQYANEKPVLDLSEYFSGTIDAYGIFTDRSGEVKKRFTVLIKANWTMVDGKKVGTLDESFEYSDGTKQSVFGHLQSSPREITLVERMTWWETRRVNWLAMP